MQDSSLGLSFARREFNKSLYELRRERPYAMPPGVRSIRMGQIQTWGFYLAGQIDSNSPATEEFFGKRKTLWDKLSAAQDGWRQTVIDGRECDEVSRERAVEAADQEVTRAWESLVSDEAVSAAR